MGGHGTREVELSVFLVLLVQVQGNPSALHQFFTSVS